MPELSSLNGTAGQPLAGLRILEYAQYVAGPFAAMLLADLGADVIKIESPAGDPWRRYEPFQEGHSRYFIALNRNKRSVVLDLKSEDGRRESERLIASADAVIHNFPLLSAVAYGLDRESVRAINPRAVWTSVSAFGSDGPQAELKAFDLVAQALSGLLLADAREGDAIPRRAGGIAMADFTAGLLAAIALLAGLVGAREDVDGHGLEVSLLGAALTVQSQRFVSVEEVDAPQRMRRLGQSPFAVAEDLTNKAEHTARHDELEPYYRAYQAADGFFVLACLNERQRRSVGTVTDTRDRFAANPQALPADEHERDERVAHTRELEGIFASEPVAEWLRRLREADVPASEVRVLDHLYDDAQVEANGLVQQLDIPGVGAVRQLGSPFKVDGVSHPSRRCAPTLGQHTHEILEQLQETNV